MNLALHGSCHVPVAGDADVQGERLQLSGWVGDAENIRSIAASAEGDAADPEALGRAVAEKLFVQGAAELLRF